MAAYLIGHITIKDATQWEIYVEGVGRSLLPYNAEILFRGELHKVLTGEHAFQKTVVIRFPDQANLQSWYESKEYQDLIPIRDRAADVTIISYDA
jgi:uncharacterized protein (DUF1330 family)